MPGFDGTGPEGLGPGTGRGRGKCVGWTSHPVVNTLASIIIPTVGIVVNDVRKSGSITRKIYKSLKPSISERSKKRIEQKPDDLLISGNTDNKTN